MFIRLRRTVSAKQTRMPKAQVPTRTLLVIDDEPDILDAIKRLFRKRCRVLVAQTISEGKRLIETEDIQVVLADQRLPKGSGIELFADIRTSHPHIVRVLFTGYTNIDHVIDAINEGHVYRYISKPWKPLELRLFIEQAFERYTHQRERAEMLEKLERQNEMLKKVNEELKTLDNVRRVFMEVISHELNTPIAILIGYTYLLRKDTSEALGANARKAIDRIEANSQRLKRISDRIFQMISSEEPSNSLDYEDVDLRDFAAELHKQVEPFLLQRDQSFVADITLDSDPVIEADRSKLMDIFTHLTMNAIKFSQNGEKIHFRASEAESADEVAISISDNGTGITEEDQKQIFGAFFSTFKTAHHSSGEFEYQKRGMGLGLSIAKRFTQMHGGEIDVTSDVGEGSTFTVRLPRYHN